MLRPRLALSPLIILVTTAACVGDDPTPSNTSSGSAPSGNAPSGSAPSGSADRFLGTWKTTTGTQTVTGCPAALTNKNVAVTLTATKGEKSDLVMTNSLAPTCSLQANITGDVARLVAGQSCISPEGHAYTYAATSTFELTKSDGSEGIVQLDATITLAGGGVCTFSETDPYTKL